MHFKINPFTCYLFVAKFINCILICGAWNRFVIHSARHIGYSSPSFSLSFCPLIFSGIKDAEPGVREYLDWNEMSMPRELRMRVFS